MVDRDGSNSASLPSAFADAPDPEPTETPKTSSNETKGADKTPRSETGLKSSGVPMTRLLGWAVPVLGVVAGVAMYNQSPPLAAGVFAVAFVIAFVMLVGTLIRRRTAKSSGSRGASGGRSSSPRAKRQWLPWSRRSGGGSGRPTGSAGGSRVSGRRGLFSRGGSAGGSSGRSTIGRKSSTSTRGGTKAPGSASTTGTVAKRTWNPLRRNRGAKSAAGSSSPSGTKSTTSAHKSTGSTGSTGSSTPRKGIRGLFHRNRTGSHGSSSTSGGHKSGHSTAHGKSSGAGSGGGSGRSLRHPFRRNPNGSKPAGGKPSSRIRQVGADRSPGSPRWRDRFTRKNPDAAKPQGAAGTKGDTRTDPEQKHRWRPWRRKGDQESTSTHGAEGNAATGSKPEKQRGRKRGEEKQRGRVYGAESDGASQHKEAARTRKETEKTLKELGPVDEMGFRLFPMSKPKPSGKVEPRKVVDPDPIETDDMGFPVYIPAKVTSINKLKEHKLSVDTSKYTAMVDPSTPQTLRNTLTSAGSAARVDAGELAEQAAELRRSAAHMQGMKGMRDAAADMLREASALDDTAEARLGMAAGFENSASTVSA